MSEYDAVLAGERVRAFLADEYVKLALAKVSEQAYFEFRRAQTDEQLRRAQAQAWAVDALSGLLEQVVEVGKLAKND